MNRIIFVLALFFCTESTFAQQVAQRLQKAFQQFENDSQLKHALSSLYVIDAKTGEVIFNKNSQVGLAGASTQKIVTAATAFELLGKDYRYKTYFGATPGVLYSFSHSNDPTFGSWRYASTVDTSIYNSVIGAFRKKRLANSVAEFCIINREAQKRVPSGWIFEDIGNYYGAAPNNLNWRENQFDIVFLPGKNEGDDTGIDTVATSQWKYLINNCKTGKPGSGDNAYVYFIPRERSSVIEGTIPAGVKRFTISAADPEPELSFGFSFLKYAASKGFFNGKADELQSKPKLPNPVDTIYTYYSPTLDSIVYWFLKKSINLYGEALIKTLASEKKILNTTENGIDIVKKFWKEKGLDENELNIYDGSGLSPMNRITTHAQVEILKYAKTKNWFPYYYDAFPDYNGMKMKSGTIGDVKGFCGYHKAKDGREYIFSFLVNNYSGKTSPVVAKMYKVLDELK